MLEADVTPIPFATGALAGAGVPGGYAGCVLHALTGSPKVRIWDNASAASGTILDAIELTASGVGSFTSYTLNPPVKYVNGIFVELVTGTVEGSIRVA